MSRVVTFHFVNVTGLCENYQLTKTFEFVMDETVSIQLSLPSLQFAGCVDESFLSANYMKR